MVRAKNLLIRYFIIIILLIVSLYKVASSEMGISHEEDISITPIPPLESYLFVETFIVINWLGTGVDSIFAYNLYKKCSDNREFIKKVLVKKNNKGWYTEYIPYIENCYFEVSSVDMNGKESSTVKILGN